MGVWSRYVRLWDTTIGKYVANGEEKMWYMQPQYVLIGFDTYCHVFSGTTGGGIHMKVGFVTYKQTQRRRRAAQRANFGCLEL